MEKLKVPHDHTFTDILKVAIFGLMLILPLLVYAPTAAYYGFNEHAVEQTTVLEGGYEVRNKYETNEVNTLNDLVEGNIYYLDSIAFDYNSVEGTNGVDFSLFIYSCEYFYIDANDRYIDDAYTANYNANNNNFITLEVILDDNNSTYDIYTTYTNFDSYCTVINESFNQIELDEVYFTYVNNNSNSFQTFLQNDFMNLPTSTDFQVLEYVYTEEHEVTKDITQMMDQNWKELWQTDLFKWTNTSILKNGLDNFTGAFGVTDTSCITNLITYELIMVGIYVLIDIVIAMFKWLTHLIGTK